MKEVNIIDSIMGSGKTSWAKQYMNKYKDFQNFIYVTPYLDEIENNVLLDCPFLTQPCSKKGKGSKLKDFKNLIKEGKSVITTHALFGLFDKEVIELIENSDYIIIIDEVANVIEQINQISKDDIKHMLDSKLIEIEEGNNKVHWLVNDYKGVFQSKYINIKEQAEQGNIYSYNKEILFWTFPDKVFKIFKEVYILTYLFDGQIQRYYYDMFNISYKYYSIKKVDEIYELDEYNPLKENRGKYKEILNIYIGESNRNYTSNKLTGYELSVTWFSKANKEQLNRLKKNTYTYFRKHGKSDDNLWTTIKDMRTKLQGKGYTKGFIPWNTRATNNYQEKHNLAFLLNIYMNPIEKRFFENAGVKVNQDLLAVSSLLQWIWRSNIRKENATQVNLYIPSLRMRTLLYQWLDHKEVKFGMENVYVVYYEAEQRNKVFN
ncbi:hypothetical protein ATL39_0952 [Sinobaca qinghaiensis]|uniref:Uncharacterized protein n=1 Tax=Sinobaca qinghaiensis TaxID=342944 RepID=A0A419V5J1_9BACL|nr:hypothetical protein [Sinobaca qinghaiensis]RKD75253.1 hypothetical protein ATL39_0952 [Sinobaca qinghaiensis]